jgi:ABC-type glycerol-3-phosphate transport system permease component
MLFRTFFRTRTRGVVAHGMSQIDYKSDRIIVAFAAVPSAPTVDDSETGASESEIRKIRGSIGTMLYIGLIVAIIGVAMMLAMDVGLAYASWWMMVKGLNVVATDKSAYAFITAALTLVGTMMAFMLPVTGKATRILFGMSFEVYKFRNDVSGELAKAKNTTDMIRKRNNYAIQMAGHFAIFK